MARPVINICTFLYACNTYRTIDIYALRAHYKNKEGTSLKRRNLIRNSKVPDLFLRNMEEIMIHTKEAMSSRFRGIPRSMRLLR